MKEREREIKKKNLALVAYFLHLGACSLPTCYLLSTNNYIAYKQQILFFIFLEVENWRSRRHGHVLVRDYFVFHSCLFWLYFHMVVGVQLLSHVKFFAFPWPLACQASLPFTISLSLLKLMSIEMLMPSRYILCHLLLLLPSIFPSIRVFSYESAFHVTEPKFWSFSFSISPSNEYSEFISFRTYWLYLLLSKGLLRVFCNTTVQKHQLFGALPSL